MDAFSSTLDNEVLCKNVFHSYLKNHFADLSNDNWHRYPNGKNKPPDFNLTIRNKIYAVEVTETKVIINTRRKMIEEKTFITSRKNFVEEVNKKAQELGILNGLYCVFFLMPWTVPFTPKLKDWLKKQLFEYIKKTKHEESSSPFKVKHKYSIVCQIFKINKNNNKVFDGFANGAWPESQQMQNYVCSILQYAISNKKKLMENIVPSPRILLLRNSYSFANLGLYKNCLPQIEDLNFFHSIFIIMSKQHGFFLFTSDKNWKSLFNV